MIFRLDLRLDELVIKEYPLEDGATLTIGRHPDNQIAAVHPTVSRRHACIARKGEEVVLWDAGSTNGTFLNGTKVTSAVLKQGDIVGIGDQHTLKVTVSEAEKGEETLTAERAWRNPEDATAVPVSAQENTRVGDPQRSCVFCPQYVHVLSATISLPGPVTLPLTLRGDLDSSSTDAEFSPE